MQSTISTKGPALWTCAKAIGCVLSIFALVACGTQEPTAVLTSTPTLSGTWKSECIKKNDRESSRMEYKFTSGLVEAHLTTFAGAQCDSKEGVMLARRQSRYELKGSTASPLNASKIDFSATRSWLKPVNKELTDVLQSSNAFGLTTWKLGEELEVTGKNFKGEPDVEGKTFSIFKVTGNRLCLGKSSDTDKGDTETTRFTELKPELECLTKVMPNG